MMLEKASQHGAPHRLKALSTPAAFCSKVLRNIAGTVSMLCREMTPSCSTWLTGLPQLSAYTLAQRQPREDGQRSATTGVPWPQSTQRYSLARLSETEPVITSQVKASQGL